MLSNYNALSFTDRVDMLKDRYNINNNFYREENNNDVVIMEKEYFLTKLSISKKLFFYYIIVSKLIFYSCLIQLFSKITAAFSEFIRIQFFNQLQRIKIHETNWRRR